MNIEGSIVALVTPMHADGSVDWDSLAKLVDWQVEQGTHAIVSVGTTGESPTLTVEEHMKVIGATVTQVAGRVPVIAGTGANSTLEAIEMTAEAAKLGADASLQVVPYYNKPSQEGMFQHFSAVAKSTSLPIILYNVPSRTVADMSNDTVVRLAQIENIVAIKDATGDLKRGADLISRVPDDFVVLSGDDETALELMKLGGKGDISVSANVAPRLMSELCEHALNSRYDQADAIDDQLRKLHTGLFVEPSPCATKWALEQMGLIEGGLRLPIIPLSGDAQPALRQLLLELSLI